jgi:hypothetical protein
MRSSLDLRARISFVLPIVVLLLTPCFPRERGPRVEVLCPLPPSPATMGKNKVVVYELHVTNFDTVPVTLRRIEIFAKQKSSEPLVTFEDDKWLAAMTRVGSAMVMSSGSNGRTQDTRMIDPGGRNVVFVWIELGMNQTVPALLSHRMIFSSTPTGADTPRDATLEDFQVPVGQDPVPILSLLTEVSGLQAMARLTIRTIAAAFLLLAATSIRRNASPLTG